MFIFAAFIFAAITFFYAFFFFAVFYHLKEYTIPGTKTHYTILILFSIISFLLWSSALFSLLAIP